MTTHAPVPAVRRVHIVKTLAFVLVFQLVLAVMPSPAPAGPKNDGKAVWMQGYVDRTSGQAIQFRGRWYELAGARIVNAYLKPLSREAIQKGAYIYMLLENGNVTQLRVYQDLGR